MAVTWEYTDPVYVDRAGGVISMSGTRTENGMDRTYTVRQFRINADEPTAEKDRLADEFEQLVNADKDWDTPDIATVFPGAAAVMKAEMEERENG